jgi:hypothetical protein
MKFLDDEDDDGKRITLTLGKNYQRKIRNYNYFSPRRTKKQ